MRLHTKHAAWVAAGVLCLTTACEVPVLPQWDTYWNVPLPSKAIPVPVVPIPNNTSVSDSFPTQRMPLDESLGALLTNAADTGSVILTLTKRQTLALSGADTLFISTSSAGLNTPGAGRIVIPIAFTATDATVSDTVSASLVLIRNTATAGDSLYIRLQGRLSNTSGSTVTPAASDSIKVKLALLTLIHSSK